MEVAVIHLGLSFLGMTRGFAKASGTILFSTMMMCLFPNLYLFSVSTEACLFPL